MIEVSPQIQIDQNKIPLNILTPDEGRFNRDRIIWMHAAFGPGITDLTRLMQHDPDDRMSAEYLETQAHINAHFAHFMQETYGHSETADLMHAANGVHRQITGTMLPSGERFTGQKNPLNFEFSSITDDRLRYVVQRSSDVNPVYQHQIGLQLFYGHLTGLLRRRSEEHRLNGKINDVLQNLDDTNYWVGRPGDTEWVTLFTEHSNVTNKVISIDDQPVNPTQADSHIKRISMPMRAVNIGGREIYLSAEPREKRTGVAKAIRDVFEFDPKDSVGVKHDKARRLVNPLQAVRDSVGLQHAVYGGIEERDAFAEYMLEGFQDRFPVTDITFKHQVTDNGLPGSKAINYLRYMVEIDGFGVPFELIVYDMESYLNSQYQIRLQDDPNAPLDGPAHGLFEIARLEPAFRKALYPAKLYVTPKLLKQYQVDEPDQVYDKLIGTRKKQVAKQLVEDNQF